MLINDVTLTVIYFSIALGVSFLCSILEAVLLSITPQYVALQINKGKTSGKILKSLKSDMNKPLTAILTLNTVAHTMGAAGVGAQITKLYGNEYLTVSSIILTVLILFFSEIIPKTIGTYYWRFYANYTALFCHFLTKVLWPVIEVSKIFVRILVRKKSQQKLHRDEFKAITELAIEQKILLHEQAHILKQLLELDNITVKEIMTPRTVMFTVSEDITVEQYYHQHDKQHFSRIPVYEADQDNIVGFVMRNELLLSQARGNNKKQLVEMKRPIEMILDSTKLLSAFNTMIKNSLHIAVVINEYGDILGMITLEDILEHLIGFEIVDEHDQHIDMQSLVKKMNKNQSTDQSESS